MKLFNNFKNFLKKDDIQVEEQIVNDCNPICDYCGRSIFGEQKVKSFGGKKYHLRPCWRELQKQSYKKVYGN